MILIFDKRLLSLMALIDGESVFRRLVECRFKRFELAFDGFATVRNSLPY